MAADELALLQGPGGEREGFGRRCPWLEALRTPECRQERPGGGAVACQGGLARCCEAGSAWRGAAVWAKARGASVSARARHRAIRALWARPVHALSVLDEMPEHARSRG